MNTTSDSETLKRITADPKLRALYNSARKLAALKARKAFWGNTANMAAKLLEKKPDTPAKPE